MFGNMTAVTGKNDGNRRKRRGKASYPEIQAEIEQLAQGSRMTAAEIHRILEEKFGEAHIPVVRTVQGMVEEARTLRPSEPWELADAKPEDIVLVTPVWATALEQGVRLTNKQVDWIIRVRSVAPDLPSEDVWRIVGLYGMEERVATQLRDALDALLAFAPWRDEDHAERYLAAANSGGIPVPRAVWTLVKRALVQAGEPGVASRTFSEWHTFLDNQPPHVLTGRGEAKVIRRTTRPRRRKAGGK